MCICVVLCVYKHTHVWVPAEAKEDVRSPLELQIQAVVSHLEWVPGIKPRSSVRAASTLNH